MSVFADLEEAARDEIISAGGSLSHHHGVGKARAGAFNLLTFRYPQDKRCKRVGSMQRANDSHVD